jgi:peptide/nickel transport system permease protein
MATSLDDLLTKRRRSQLSRLKSQLRTVKLALAENPQAIVGIAIVSFFLLMAAFPSQLAPYGPEQTFSHDNGLPMAMEPPTADHPLGTNNYGHDVLSQWIFGARATMLVGILSGISVGVIGTTIGLISGYYKGIVDLMTMRVVDVLYGIPAMPLVLVMTLFVGSSIWTIILAQVLVLWRTTARVIRAQTLSLSERPFVKSARAAGAGDLRIMFSHIMPNLVPLIFTETVIIVANAIILEAGVSFLGLGADHSWGTMLQLTFTTGAIRHAWWWVIPPGLSITLVVLSFLLISRAIEDMTSVDSGGVR